MPRGSNYGQDDQSLIKNIVTQFSEKYGLGPFRLDIDQNVLFRNGNEVRLGGQALSLLRIFLETRDRWLSREKILKKIWPDTHVTSHNITVHVAEIRTALDEYGECIEARRNNGYRLSHAALKKVQSREDQSQLALPSQAANSSGLDLPRSDQEVVSRMGESGPSASEFVRRQVQAMISKLEQPGHLSDSHVKELIEESLIGRDQLLRPLAIFFRTVADGAQMAPSTAPQTAVVNAAIHFLEDCHRAQTEIARRVCEILQNNDTGLADVIILADFSISIARILSQLAMKNPKRFKAMSVYLVVSSRHFNVQPDTKRWEVEFQSEHLQRFYKVEQRIRFEELGSGFEKIRREDKRAVMLMGIERAYPQGQLLDWPGMGTIFHTAGMHGIDIVVVAECYKVQPMFPREIRQTGSSIYGSQIELSPMQMGPGVYFVSDHAVHTENPHSTGGSLKCCYRFWRNRMEKKDYPIAVIFDLDGTIIDSEEVHKTLYQETAEVLGYKLTDVQYFSELRGLTDEETYRRILRLAGKKGDATKLAAEKQQKFLRCLSQKVLNPVLGVIKYIRALDKQGHILALATSATMQEVEITLRNFGLGDIFQAVISSEQVVVGKPSPEVYWKAVQSLGLKPSECLVYEDSLAGIRAALAAQIRVVAVGNIQDEVLARSGVEMIIPDFLNHEVPQLKTR